MTNTGTEPYAADQAVTILTGEGWPEADVRAAIDSLIDAGLTLPQPDGHNLLTADELGVIERQLRETE